MTEPDRCIPGELICAVGRCESEAEARHLAGTGPAWPGAPEARALDTLRDWLHGLTHSRRASVRAAKIVADLTVIPEHGPGPHTGSERPTSPRPGQGPPPGRPEYLGGGTVRLDEAAIAALAGLSHDEDFRIIFTDAGPVLVVGSDRYIVDEEQPDPKP